MQFDQSNISDIDQPTLSLSTQSPVVDSSITMTCVDNSNPPASEIKFFQGDKLISTGSTNKYSIQNVRKGNSGSYRCETRNTVSSKKSKSKTLDVLCKLSFHRGDNFLSDSKILVRYLCTVA